MTTTVSAPQSMLGDLRDFIKQEGIDLSVAGRGGLVRIVRKSRVHECDIRTLRAGGNVSCAVARSVSQRLSIPPLAVGRLMDHLGIKIRRCELGCFS